MSNFAGIASLAFARGGGFQASLRRHTLKATTANKATPETPASRANGGNRRLASWLASSPTKGFLQSTALQNKEKSCT